MNPFYIYSSKTEDEREKDPFCLSPRWNDLLPSKICVKHFFFFISLYILGNKLNLCDERCICLGAAYYCNFERFYHSNEFLCPVFLSCRWITRDVLNSKQTAAPTWYFSFFFILYEIISHG